MLAGKEDSQADTEACEADSRTSLEQLIALLQGGHTAALADAGLTALGVEQWIRYNAMLRIRRSSASNGQACCFA